MEQKIKELIETRLNRLQTQEGSKGVIIIYKGQQLILESGKRIWSKKQHASSALGNYLYGLHYDLRKEGLQLDNKKSLSKQLEEAGIVEFKTLK